MPIPATMNLPRTNDSHEFECMVADVLSEKYNIFMQPFGRRGQKQFGIDTLSSSSFDIVAQCKNYSLQPSDIDTILNVFTLEKGIRKFIIATSMNFDTSLQLYVTSINSNKTYPYQVVLLFWDEIQTILCQNNTLLSKYYPTLVNSNSDIDNIRRDFNDGIQKYNVISFLRRDVFVDGIPVDLPTDVETFTTEIKNLLSKNILLQTNQIYKSIFDFCNLLDSYNGWLGLKLFPTPNSRMYRYIPNYNIDEEKYRKEMISQITLYLRKLDSIYGEINSGVTLFP